MRQREKHRVERRKRGKIKSRRRVLVGETWPGKVEVQVDEKRASADAKTRTVVGLAMLFGVLLVLLAVYAVWKPDQGMIEELFDFVRLGIAAILVWAGGTAVLNLLSKFRLDDTEQ